MLLPFQTTYNSHLVDDWIQIVFPTLWIYVDRIFTIELYKPTRLNL